MRNLIVYKDFQFPRYLQIIPSKSVPAMIPELNIKGEAIKHNPGRISIQGYIDMVTTPDQPVNIGDEFKTPVSIIKINAIKEQRPAKGNFSQAGVTWMRCEFAMVKSLIR